MPVEPLPNLPHRSFILIDANIFIYGLSGQSSQCRQFLERCLLEDVTGLALLETVNEATHRFMVAEALSKGLIISGGAKILKHNFQVIPNLTDYWRNTQRLLALNLLLVPVNEAIVRNAQAIRQEAGLLTTTQ